MALERQLWREPPCRCCVRRDDWQLTAARRGAAAVEVSLRRVDGGARWASAAAALAAAAAAAAAASAAAATAAGARAAAGVAALCVLALLLLAARVAGAGAGEEQRVLAVRGLGLALTDLRGGAVVRRSFVPARALRSILVNEGIQRCDVAFYLACVVAGRDSLLLLFEAARPRLPVLAKIHRELDAVMFPRGGRGEGSDEADEDEEADEETDEDGDR
jgi:hypothetical protein